ncbi:hypothetical protein RFI_23819 [Reticulomyxa filosa]|uniref:Anoctamin transmembrane domain-containing protein n=1 Tax=Reticulomyxa filosa TaxID=46433 RepID=X6MHQ4_RETFI|nr:hypothetical protein RFI_23819 [Reticulomyxa filosa]|eukprot:ETO13548.1 hypothetical protein RFI_23819 [Reticulomyxa filosa]
MLEQWYRLESRLQYEWGMTNYQRMETPRAGFAGVLRISPGNGALEYTYQSKTMYYFKIASAMSAVTFCMACVVVVVVQIWNLQTAYKDSTNRLWVGIVNAVQIQVFNYLYVNISLWLNNFENHRLEQEYYNSLVIKRILFYIVNSFNSLFYLAFYQTWDSNQDCLQAVRMQLVVIFLMAIFIQNFMEVFSPNY